MKTLFDIVSAYVGEHSSLYSPETLKELPRRVLQNILPYLNAAHLHQITSADAGLSCGDLWKSHVQKRWNRIRNVSNFKVSSDDEVVDDFHQMYLIKHFLDLLNYCCLNVHVPDPIGLLHCPLHKMRPWNIVTDPSTQSSKYLKELVHYARYAEVISLVGSQCSWICCQSSVIQQLLKVTKVINLHVINDTYYEGVRTLLWNLINNGVLEEANFSSITSTLSNTNLLDLMKICAGANVQQNLQTGSSRKSVKRAREESPPKTYTTSVILDSGYDTPVSKRVCVRLDDPDNTLDNSVASITTSEEMPNLVDVIDFTDEGQSSSSDYVSAALEPSAEEDSSINSEQFDIDLEHTSSTVNTDLYDEAVQPVMQTERKPHSSIMSREPSSSESYMVHIDPKFNCRGVSSFSITCSNIAGLVLVLQSWTSLRKICLGYAAFTDFLMEVLLEKVRGHQLSHLVLDDCCLPEHFYQRLLQELQTYKTPDQALELIDIQACSVPLSVFVTEKYKEPQFGVKRLVLSMNTFTATGLDALVSLIRHDGALTHLKLNGCFLQEKQLLSLLEALTEKRQLQVLGLSGNLIMENTVEEELTKFLTNVSSLTHITLNYSRLRPQYLCNPEFLSAVKNHPNLRDISMKNNHLDASACEFLKHICSDGKSSLKHLNIGYNWIKVDDLVKCADKMQTIRDENEHPQPVLHSLILSGNRFEHRDQARVREVFSGLVHQLEVNSVDTSPYNEHLAQM